MEQKRYLHFDCETMNSGLEYSVPPEKFVRMFQYAWDDGDVQITYDLEEARSLIREARWVVGHNIISADLGWIFGPDSTEPLQLAMQGRVIDTFTIASLVRPAPSSYTTESGHTFYGADKPGTALKWLSLSNLCYQFGVPGKFGDLKELAARHNPEKTPKNKLDFGLIPLDDPDFIAYAIQDVEASRGLWDFLREVIVSEGFSGDYIWRELKVASAMAQMSRNGIKVDTDWAADRIEEMMQVRVETLRNLEENYGFPTEGKAPWSTSQGKAAILKVLAEYGITEKSRPDWPRTPTGSLKLGGDDLKALAEGSEAEEFAASLAVLKGQRSLAQLTLDSMHPDGRVHPDITSLQRSGRWSFTKPGVTVFGSNGGRDVDKSILIASEGNVLAGFDFSNADPRAMAALSGDAAFAIRFTENDPETGMPYDGHNLSGEALFGKDVYYSRLDSSGRPLLRPVSKAAANAMNYNIGPKKLATTLNAIIRREKIDIQEFTVDDAREMIRKFDRSYALLKRYKDKCASEGENLGFVVNDWGRKMPVDPERSWTMAPAMAGQGSVRELMADAILRLVERGDYYARALRAVIHDELLLEFSEKSIEEDIRVVKECMEVTFQPKHPVSIPIDFPVGYGFGRSWRDAGH